MTTIEGGDDKHYTLDNSVSIVKSITVPTDSKISGQVTVTTAGTAVQHDATGTSVALNNGVWVKALAANTGVVYVGNDGNGDVASTNGFQLSAGQVILVPVENLNELWFDAATSGDKFCWLKA